MRIQHNIAALNSYRQLSGNNSAVSKNLEKLSSGYKINRAGDDAAGLAISEKMRAQITGLETAQKNANDGISLVQTAEGALTEVHSMLNRMVELANQSANGTYDDKTDRANLQKEVKSLLDEIDRISDSTNFNGINLLDGSLGGPKATTELGKAPMIAATGAPTGGGITVNGTDGQAGQAAKVELSFDDITITDKQVGAKAKYTIGDQTVEIEIKESTGQAGKMTKADIADAVKAQLNGKKVAVGTGGSTGAATATASAAGVLTLTSEKTLTTENWSTTHNFTANTATFTNGKIADPANPATATKKTLDFDGRIGEDMIGGTIKIGDTTYEFVETGKDPKTKGATAIEVAKNDTAQNIATAVQGKLNNVKTKDDANADVTWTAAVSTTKNTAIELTAGTTGAIDFTPKFSGFGANLQVGDTSDSFNKVKVSVDSMSSESLGIDKIDIGTQIGGSDAIQKIKDAINSVSSTRGDLGAIQNRLEHTINNLSVTTENMTAAESRIRDTDMAKEMMAYTKNNILVQASQAMLAQANQVPQGVLQLLQ